MRTHAFRTASLVIVALLATATARPATAQGAGGGSLSIGAEVGPRSYMTKLDPLSIGKFEEYRDMRARDGTSPLFEQLVLKWTPADSFGIYSLSARKLGDRDQSIFLHAQRPGQYDFQFHLDGITHTYSTTARSPGGEFGSGANTLPVPRPDSTAWRTASTIGPLRNQWDPIRATLAMTPIAGLDLKADWTQIHKHGGIPRSISYNASSGPQREYVSPIDQTVSDFRLSQDYASGVRTTDAPFAFLKSYQFAVSYGYSKFSNAIKSTMVDNPQQAISTLAAGAASSRVSLEPDNTAQTISATGALLFPYKTRLAATMTTSYTRQNDAFFPQTSNDTLLARDPNARLLTLSRSSLDAKARRSSYAVSLTSHPLDGLSLALKTRQFDYWTQVAPFRTNAMAISDRSIALADAESYEPLPFTRKNTDAGASYLVMRGLTVSGGYAWDDMERDPEVRNLETTKETSPRLAVDYSAFDWFSIRASYTTARRRGSAYTEAATEIIGFRRPDEADRDKTRMTFIGSVTPIDEATLSLTYQTGTDKFPNSQYGVQQDNSTMTAVDVDWTPHPRFTASVGWSGEDVKDSAAYRYRTGAVGSITYDNPTFRWMNTNKDKNTSYYIAINAAVIPDKLDMIASWAVNDSKWWMYNANLATPSCPAPAAGQTACTATNLLNATAQDWPEVSQRLEPMSVGFRYNYSKEWALTFRYQSEKYSQNDFRTLAPVFTTDGLNASPVLVNYKNVVNYPELPGTIGQVAGSNTGQYHFLGNNFRPFTTDWLTFTVTYQPSLLQWARGRSTF